VIRQFEARAFARTDLRVVVLAATLPLLLLHPDHVPLLASAGGVDVRPSDFAILLVVGLAIASPRDAVTLRAARRWFWLGPFMALLVYSAAKVPGSGTAIVAVLKLGEYAAFGVAATVLLRSRHDLRIIVACLACCAAFFGFVGVWQVVREHQLGARAESLMGIDPLGLLGATVFVIVLAGPGFLSSRAARWGSALAGAFCVVVSASVSATLAIACAVAFAAARRLGPFSALGRRRFFALVATALAITGAVVAVRWSDITGAADQLTASSYAAPQPGGSFVQRMMFADFGARIWLDHPLLGVGFQQTPKLREWAPYFASVRADFPGLDITYFPPIGAMAFGRPRSTTVFGLHNVYSQLLAETGVVGLVLFAVGFGGFVAAAFRRASRSDVAFAGSLLALCVLAGFTNSELYGGLPATTIAVVALAIAARGAYPMTPEADASVTI
jgi:O-antigen ligase